MYWDYVGPSFVYNRYTKFQVKSMNRGQAARYHKGDDITEHQELGRELGENWQPQTTVTFWLDSFLPSLIAGLLAQ